MDKISYAKFLEMTVGRKAAVPNIQEYLTLDPRSSRAFSPRFVVNSAKVELSEEQQEVADMIDWANAVDRADRQERFIEALQNGDSRPVLVAEGDSWFQYPFLIQEVIDHLSTDFLIWSMGAAGDTVANMTGPSSEYMRGLDRWKEQVKGFLFSAGGNDVLGEDETGNPVIARLVKQYDEGQSPAWHIERSAFDPTLNLIEQAYTKMIRTIRPNFPDLPIFIHGYDYPFPYPFGSDDKRESPLGGTGRWLGTPFADKGFPQDNAFSREVLIVIIDALYAMMSGVAGQEYGRIFVVNARGSMPSVECWYDEIHGTDDGFERVAGRFKTVVAPLAS